MNVLRGETVEVTQRRYDELLRKESMLDTIKKLHGKTSDYVFRDVVGFLFSSDVEYTPSKGVEKTDD